LKTKKTTEQEIKACLRKLYRLVHKYYDEEGYDYRDPEREDYMDYYASICIGDVAYGRVCRMTVRKEGETYTDVMGFKESY